VKSRWIALFLVLAIAPGAMEVAEIAVHYAKYGDLADAIGDAHGTSPLGDDEHGCSGTFHFCQCHGGQSARTPDRIATAVQLPTPRPRANLPAIVSLHGLLPAMPELRPPIG
jgi:hypothetical protein